MKRYLVLFVITVLFASCQEDVKFNSPGFQGRKDDVFWKANDPIAELTGNKLAIKGLTEHETIVLKTINKAKGIYVFGTSITENSAQYSADFDGVNLLYSTAVAAYKIALNAGGNGYVTSNSVSTTGGTGSGLKLNIMANSSGVVTSATIFSRGVGYKAGDVVTVVGGNNNCKITIVNVQDSNGEVEITEYDDVNMTVTGKFKFNAVKASNSPTGAAVVNFQYGEFYKVPVFVNP